MDGAEDADGLSMSSQSVGQPLSSTSGTRGQPTEVDSTP